MNDSRRLMPGSARQLGFDTLRNGTLARHFGGADPRSTPCVVAASGVAGEGCRWGPDAEVAAISCHIRVPMSPRGRFHSWTAPGSGGGPFTKEIAMSAMSLRVAQEQFTAHLSAVENAARFAFRRRRRQDREEALAEAAPPPGAPGSGCSAGARTRSKSVSRDRQQRDPLRQERPAGRQHELRPGAMDIFRRPGPATSVLRLDSNDQFSPGRWSGRGRTGWP